MPGSMAASVLQLQSEGWQARRGMTMSCLCGHGPVLVGRER